MLINGPEPMDGGEGLWWRAARSAAPRPRWMAACLDSAEGGLGKDTGSTAVSSLWEHLCLQIAVAPLQTPQSPREHRMHTVSHILFQRQRNI